MLAACLPVLIWSVHFALIYGLTALACARRLDVALSWTLGAAAVAAVLMLGAVAVPAYRRMARTGRFTDVVALGLGALAALAIVWETSSVLGARPCA